MRFDHARVPRATLFDPEVSERSPLQPRATLFDPVVAVPRVPRRAAYHTAVLFAPLFVDGVTLFHPLRLYEPKAVLFADCIYRIDSYPRLELSDCVVIFIAEYGPRAEFLDPVVFAESAEIPTQRLSPPLVVFMRAEAPSAVFPVAVLEKSA